MKICVLCKEPKPLTRFHKSPKQPDGYVPYCLDCRKHPEGIGLSYCLGCKAGLPLTQFQFNTVHKSYFHYCKVCDKKYKDELETKKRLLKYDNCAYRKLLETYDYTTHNKSFIKFPICSGNIYAPVVIGFTYVDADWLPILKNYFLTKMKGYVVLNLTRYTSHILGIEYRRVTMRLHRFVMGLSNSNKSLVVDHMKGFTLDNRSKSLRLATPAENSRNTFKLKKLSSKFKGVSYCSSVGKWKAGLQFEWSRVHLGYFNSEVEAAKAYDSYALKYFGEFAKTNKDIGLL